MNNSTDTKPTKLSKWRLQDAAAIALGDSWATSSCMRRQNGSHTKVHKSNGKAHYTGLQTCKSVWACPICSSRIASQRRDEVKLALENSHYIPILVTYTIQHSLKDKIRDLLCVIKDGLRHTLNGRFRKTFYERFCVAGYVRSVEVRWNPKTGWHPHVHELLMLKREASNEAIKSFLQSRYGEYLKKRGYHVNEHTIDVRSNDDTESGDLVSEYLTKSAVELEITAGALKKGHSLSQFQLLAAFAETGDMMYADLFQEYAQATAGKKWLTWSRGLRAELLPDVQEETDEEIAGKEEEGEGEDVVLILDRDEWRRVCNMRLRGNLLAVVAVGLDDLDSWLHDKGIRLQPKGT